MSFKFNWDPLTNDDHFYDRVTTLLTDALNKGKKPSILADKITVRELYLGEESPQLEILEVGDLADDRFQGIFKLTYHGNASITLATKIRANPLQVYAMSAPEFSLPKFQGSSQASLAIPLNLTLSDITLSGIIILVFSKAKGLTLVFRNDPLQSIRVTSTFDTLPGIARFLQTQIETQIRSLFREDLPAILHTLSHRWTPSGSLMLEKQRLQQQMEEQQQQQRHQQKQQQEASYNEDSPGSEQPPLSDIPSPEYMSQNAFKELNRNTDSVSFADINPDMPVFSPESMKKQHSLHASQLTLSLATHAIPETAYRTNLFLFDRNSSIIQSLQGPVDLDEIARIQSRSYFKNSHKKPKRRVINVGRKSAPEAAETKPATKSATAQSQVAEGVSANSKASTTNTASTTTTTTNTSTSSSIPKTLKPKSKQKKLTTEYENGDNINVKSIKSEKKIYNNNIINSEVSPVAFKHDKKNRGDSATTTTSTPSSSKPINPTSALRLEKPQVAFKEASSSSSKPKHKSVSLTASKTHSLSSNPTEQELGLEFATEKGSRNDATASKAGVDVNTPANDNTASASLFTSKWSVANTLSLLKNKSLKSVESSDEEGTDVAEDRSTTTTNKTNTILKQFGFNLSTLNNNNLLSQKHRQHSDDDSVEYPPPPAYVA